MSGAVFVVTPTDVISYGVLALFAVLAGALWCAVRFDEWRERQRKGRP